MGGNGHHIAARMGFGAKGTGYSLGHVIGGLQRIFNGTVPALLSGFLIRFFIA